MHAHPIRRLVAHDSTQTGASCAGRDKRIAVQLALALADLAIQMWGTWESPAEDLIVMFGSDASTIIGLLEFLKVLPEEIGNPLLCLTHADREFVALRLGQNCVSVLPFLQSCAETYTRESAIIERTFACLESWLRFGGEVTVPIVDSPLLPACFDALVSNDVMLRDVACDAIVSAVYLGRDVEHHPGLRDIVVDRSLLLRATFAAAAAEDDYSLAQSVTRVLVEVAEALVDPNLVMGQPTAQQMAAIEAMGEVAQYDDADTVQLTFGFWYRFSTEIYDAQRPMTADESDAFLEPFRPFFRALYGCLLRLVRCEAEIEAMLGRDEELSDFRERAADLVIETRCVVYVCV